ncbi:hypothetical protein [Metabacillus sp. FJAT-52054]|uniref:Replication protein n=1 Tax=Metabacillus sediminis TaxID=3117746 RepID=A0ABZ2NNK8_9BACI
MEFFPLYVEQMEEDEKFKKLSPTKKCYYFLMQSQANKIGEYYMSDTDFAAALNCSHETITAARKEFVKNNWIEIIPGRIEKNGRFLTTVYKKVKWSKTPKIGDGKRFVQFQRFALEKLLGFHCKPEIILVYVCLYYWQSIKSLEDGNFFISKKKMHEITGIKSAKKIEQCLEELHDIVAFSGNERFFDYEITHHQFKILNWGTPVDPSIDSTAYSIQRGIWNDIKERGTIMQQEKKAKDQERKLKRMEKVYNFFVAEQSKITGKKPAPFGHQINEFLSHAVNVGEERMVELIIDFFKDSNTKSQKKTLGKFLETLKNVK